MGTSSWKGNPCIQKSLVSDSGGNQRKYSEYVNIKCFLNVTNIKTESIRFSPYQAVGDYKPQTLVLDMERAASEAFLQVFGPTEIIWDYIYWRKVYI